MTRSAGVRIVAAIALLASCGVGLAADRAPQRIVSIVPSITEMLFAMGIGSRVVAVSSFDHYPPQVSSLPKVGALLDPDVERIFALRPDLVVAYASQVDLVARLKGAGIPVFAYAHAGLADVTATILAVGERVGAPDAARREAVRLDAGLQSVRDRVRGRPRPSTLLVIGREPMALRNIYVSGGYGFLHDLLDVAGGKNVFADVKRESLQATTEQILARGPEVIVELHYGSELGADAIARERQAWDRLSAVPAVRNGRVELLVGDEFVIPGPRLAQAADRLARALHPEVYR
jgi:iron complex transport system substrate-binding protein